MNGLAGSGPRAWVLPRQGARLAGPCSAVWSTWLGACLLGCLDDAPTFAPRERIPPFVIAGQVEPPLGAIYHGPIPFSIHVPFRSEDVNRPLEARVYADLPSGAATAAAPRLVETIPIAAGNYSDETRSASIEWTQALETGCHSVTLIITYEVNFDTVTALPVDDSLAARIVWWLNVDGEDGSASLDSCPGPSQGEDL